MAVGKTKEGESLPANPSLENPVPLVKIKGQIKRFDFGRTGDVEYSLVHDNGWSLICHDDEAP